MQFPLPNPRAAFVAVALAGAVALAACRPASPESAAEGLTTAPVRPTAPNRTLVEGPATPAPTSSTPRLSVQDARRPRIATGSAGLDDVPLLRTAEQELLLRSARNALALGNLAEALDLFDSYLLQLPDDQEVRVEYAGLLVREGRMGRAKEMYEEAIAVRPHDTVLRRSMADVLIMGGEYAAATRQLEAIVEREPENLDAAAMLCRTWTWLKDFERAQGVFDRYLRKLDPSVEADQLLLAPVLLDMQQPKAALPYLERLHRRFPRELRWATHMVLCYELTGQAERAAKTVEAMADLEPDVIDSRIHLVDQLLALANYKLALAINEQVLSASPEDPMAQLMAARILLEAYDIARAKESLAALETDLGGLRAWQLASAQLHQQTGEWVAAQSIYEMMLLSDPTDHDVRLRLAALQREKGDVHRAKAELRKIPFESPQGPRARLELASTLVSQGRSEDAVGICSALLAQRPNDVEAALGLARAQIEMGAFVQAKATCQRFIEEHGADTMAIGQIRVVLARAHLMEGNAIQAARIYQLALQEPTVHSPAVFYGLSLARSRGVSAASGEMALMSSAVLSSGEDVRLRIELGKLALGDQDHERAIAYLSNVLRWQPDNLTALVLLGEAQNLALKAGESVDPLRTFSTVLARNPGNTRARLGLARSHVIRREFEDAVGAYEGLVAQDATYAFARREYARALYWDHRYPDAFEAYDELLAGLPTEAIAVDVFGSGTPGSGLRAELDFEAELELSEAVRLELDAKANRDWRPELAISALERLVVVEPANQEARFDLAQLLHRRGRTSRAILEYQDLLEVSGGHSEATEALAGARREVSPHLDVITGSEERNGRDGLAFIDESWTLTDIAFPFGDRDDYAGLGIGRRSYSTSGDQLNANVLRLFGATRIGDNTTISGRVEVPSYDRDDLLKDRVYYDVGLRYVSDDELAVDLRLFSEPLVQNFVTLDRDINRGGARIGLTKKSSRRVDYGGSVMFANYSDENSQFEGNVFAAYEFTPAPQEFRLLLKGDFSSFSEESIAPPDPLDLTTLAVPYFSPKGYSIYSLQADWKHQFGPDWFTGSKDMYYRATTRGAIDSNSVGYFELDVGAAYDFTDWFGIQAGVRMLRSSAIDLTSSNALLTIRWP